MSKITARTAPSRRIGRIQGIIIGALGLGSFYYRHAIVQHARHWTSRIRRTTEEHTPLRSTEQIPAEEVPTSIDLTRTDPVESRL